MPRALFRIAPLRAVLLLFAAVFLLGGCAGLTRDPASAEPPRSECANWAPGGQLMARSVP